VLFASVRKEGSASTLWKQRRRLVTGAGGVNEGREMSEWLGTGAAHSVRDLLAEW